MTASTHEQSLVSSWAKTSISDILSSPGWDSSDMSLDEYSDVDEAIENFKAFFGLFGSPDCDQTKLREAFEKTFDQHVTGLTYPIGTSIKDVADQTKRVAMNFEELFEQACEPYSKMQVPVKIVSIRSLLKGMIEYVISGEYLGRYVTIRSHALIWQGKVVRLERIETVFRSNHDERATKEQEKKRIRHGSQLEHTNHVLHNANAKEDSCKVKHASQLLD